MYDFDFIDRLLVARNDWDITAYIVRKNLSVHDIRLDMENRRTIFNILHRDFSLNNCIAAIQIASKEEKSRLIFCRMIRYLRTLNRPMISSMPRLAATVPVRYAHAISNPTLANIEGRWEKMSEDERVDIIEQLSERQKGPWGELTPAEKKAAWYISYGAWGPRKPTHPPGEVKKIVTGIFGVIAAAAVIFGIFRLSAPAPPHTMSKEWQEAVNDVLKENKANPFSGYDQVQSISKGPLPEGDDDDDDE